MAVTPEQAEEAWNLFGNTPLWAKWPEIHSELIYRLSLRSVKAGNPVYRPGDPADFLYLIRNGTVLQTIRHEGQAWFQRNLTRGGFFGQHSLFTGKHHTGAVATVDSELFLMTAADLRMALERNPDLREFLLREKVAARLRSIPVFECMPSDDMGWLALLMEDKILPPGTPLPVRNEPGLWVIDWGQVAVNGPAALNRPDWRLTAGNFVLSPDALSGVKAVADDAVTKLQTRLLHLAAVHLRRLAAAFPDLVQLAGRPINISAILEQTRELQGPGMTTDHFRHLAQICAWNFVPAGQNITTQGTVGYSFITINKGAAVVNAVDNEGRLRPQNLVKEGNAFGITSLLQSKRRDATVRAVASGVSGVSRLAGTEILDLDRRDLRYAFAEAPDLWHSGVWLYDRSEVTRESRPRYSWLDEGETVVWNDRPHWLWLALPQLGLLFGFTLLAAVLSAFKLTSGIVGSVQSLLVFGLIYLPVAVILAVNYFNDYYVITNRRVTRCDRRWLVWEQRLDAPLEMVQDITVEAGLLGRIFDFGDVSVRTAAKIGAIRLVNVPRAEDVKNLILQERAGVAAASRGQHKEILRRGLVDRLGLAQPVPDPDQVRALGADARPPQATTPGQRLRNLLWPDRGQQVQALPGARKPKPDWLLRLTRPLPQRLQYVLVGPPVPATKPNPGQIVWRKHWINLVMRAGTAALAVICLLLLMVAVSTPPGEILGPYRSGFVLILLVLLIPASLWFLWDYVDYRNDIYVVTDEKIIDIERKPLGLASSRRESTLDRIQNVSSRQDGLLANILNFGTVEIQTAAMDAGFTFFMVGQPKQVQRIIFQKVDVYRRLQEEKALGLRQRELIEGIQVYHEMLRDKEEGRI